MDVLANHSIFQELQLVHDTGYFSAMPSLEENWQQVRHRARVHLFTTRARALLFLHARGRVASHGPLTGESTHARAHTRMHGSLRTHGTDNI